MDKELCVVCGWEGASRHYDGLCCAGCKSFFLRSIRYKKRYICTLGNCDVSGAHRNGCRGCRLKKCLEMGLKPELVTDGKPTCDDVDFPSDPKLSAIMPYSRSIQHIQMEDEALKKMATCNLKEVYVKTIEMQTHEMFCLVCAEPGAGKHYGSLCCSGCKGFFRRSIRTKRFYICSYNNDCLIRKEYRNCCRSCRMKKCINVGMNPKLVHSDRGAMTGLKNSVNKQMRNLAPNYQHNYFCHDSPELPTDFSPSTSNTTTNFIVPDSTTNPMMMVCKRSPISEEEIEDNYVQQSGNLAAFSLRNSTQWQSQRDSALFVNSSTIMLDTDKLPLGTKSWIPLFQRSNFNSVIKYYMSVDDLLDRFAEHDHSHIFTPEHLMPVNSDIDLQHAFIEPRSIMERTKIDWSLAFPIQGALNRIWLRVGMYYLDWMSHVPELKRLSLDDRLKLTASRSMACIWAIVAQRSAAVSMERKGIALSGGVYYPIDQSIEKHLDKTIVKYLGTLSHFVWDELVEQIRRLNVTDAELCILRILCLASPVPCLSREGREVVRETNSYYMSILYKTVCEITTGSPEKIPTRLCDLLGLLPSFEKAAILQDDSFSMATIEDINGLNNNLVTDYHLRKTYRN